MQAAPGAGLPPVHPIDHGYAWMVALGAFGLHFFITGGMRSAGLLFIEVVDVYKADKGLTALVIGLLGFGFAVFSAVGNAVGAMSTMRRACLIGSVLIFFGLLFTFAAGNIMVVVLSLGLLSGIGYGFAYSSCLVLVGQYFDKRRSLAMGLATAGGSTGTLLLPLFLNYTITKYGFHGALLIYSALSLHTIPAAMLLRPTAFYEVKRRRNVASLAVPVVAPLSGRDNNNEAASAAGSQQKQPRSSGQSQHSGTIDRETRYKLVGSRLYPAVSETSLFDNNELLAEAAAEAAAAAVADSANVTGSGPSQVTSPATPPKITLGLAVRVFLKRLFDRDLLRSWAYFVFTLGISVGHTGFIGTCFFVPPYAVERWRSKKLASFLLTLFGISDLIGRLGVGWFADLGLIRRSNILAVSFLIAGFTSFLVTFFKSFVIMSVAACLLGCLGGCYLALLAVIVADLFGVEKLAPGMGLTSLFMGLTLLPCPSILGSLQKVTGSYSITLQLSGVLIIIGGVSCLLIPKMQLKDAARKKAKEQPAAEETSTMIKAGSP